MILTFLLREHLLSLLVHPWMRVCVCHLMLSSAAAEDISWSSNFFGLNQDSQGNVLDENFTFHLGVFHPPPPGSGESAWVPSVSNTSEWASHWITADAISYNSATTNFSGSYDAVAQVEGVSLTGKQGYIWGLNRVGDDSEWILVTNPSWIWPAPGAGGIGGFGADWIVDESTAIVGTINADGVHMRTAAVSGSLPPLLRAELWQQAHFTQNEILNEEATVSGWLADPNKNGLSNLLEYALGTPPRLSHHDNGPEHGFLNVTGEEYQTLSVSIDPATEAIMFAEVSDDLVQWHSGITDVLVQSATANFLVFRDLTPLSLASSFRGIRLNVTLP